MTRSADLGQLSERFDVGRAVIEIVVRDQRAVGLAAQLPVLLFIQLLEDRALIPGCTLETLERLVQVLLRDVHEADLEHLIRLGVVDQVVEPAPRALERLKSE